MGGLAILPKSPAFPLNPFPFPNQRPIRLVRADRLPAQGRESRRPIRSEPGEPILGGVIFPRSYPHLTLSLRHQGDVVPIPARIVVSRRHGEIDPDGPFPSWHLWPGVSLPCERMPAQLGCGGPVIVQ